MNGMKQILYILFAGVFSCSSQNPTKAFVIEGVIKNSTSNTAYLEEVVPNANPIIVDSAALKTDGSFTLKTKAKEEGLYQLRLKDKPTPFALFINDASKIKVDADLNNANHPYTVEGSAATQAMMDFDKAMMEQGMNIVNKEKKIETLNKEKVT